MKPPDLYTDWKIVIGLALIALGAGNWMVGRERTQIYSRMLAAAGQVSSPADYRSFDELDADAGGAVLDPLTAEERQLSYATARMDFYHAAYLTGRVIVLLGVLIMLAGFIGAIKKDTRRALRPPPEPGELPPGGPAVRVG